MKIRAVIAVILAFALSMGACALAEDARLTVQGSGLVTLDPDNATIIVGVRESAADVGEAQSTVNAKLADVVEKLRSMGVKDEDIQTNSIDIFEDYDYSSGDDDSPRRFYSASNSISVTIADIDNAGSYIDAVFEAGANTFSGISFEASDTEAAKKRALELSVENARKKAEILARAAGMEITGITSIAEQDSGMYGNYLAKNSLDFAVESADAGGGTLVFSNQIQVSATVTVEYAMAPSVE